jgi:hypothetical protein
LWKSILIVSPLPSDPASTYVVFCSSILRHSPLTIYHQKIRAGYEQVVDPLMTAIKRELAAIVSRLHRLDLQKAIDPMAGMAGTSLYMKDLVDKLNFVKTGILSNFAPEVTRTW